MLKSKITAKNKSSTLGLQIWIYILRVQVVKTMEDYKQKDSSVNNELSAAFCYKTSIKEQSVTGAAQGCSSDVSQQNKAPSSATVPEATLTTKQLLQYWNNMNKKVKPIRLLFDIPETRTVEEQGSKYVMYKVVVIKSGTYDGSQAYAERRYSDFEKLHKNILRNFKEEIEGITFPKKIVAGNFMQEKIIERKLALMDYLGQLYAIKDIRESDEFIEFFYLPEVQEGYNCLRSGQYTTALNCLLNVLSLQEKLCMRYYDRLVLTLSAISVCCRDLGNIDDAYQFCEKGGLILPNHSRHKYLIPLLKVQINLGNELGKDMRHLQKKVTELEEQHGCQSNLPSLKELVVQEYIQ
ncbi:sorting nexin-20 isoform X1 [Hemiscyllium ocellatum]|uniref:sorting nexin-20 isoform X1 n=2 Tax=Hemiscyllium ocellatum TaxID=170820 RepID=UPI002965D2BA|nr:sorting nexin-20 isoform X1 [Hemiscyllium ocellatum]